MNKKIIKYLIWIIIIAAALILMQTKQTMATIGDVLSGRGWISYTDFQKSRNIFCLNRGKPFTNREEFSCKTFTIKDFKDITDCKVKDEDVEGILTYIVSEASRTDRSDVSNYAPQLAIWKLCGSSVSDATVYNKAVAYNEFFKNAQSVKNPEICDNGDGYTFSIYYTQTSANGQTYSNLKSVNVNNKVTRIETAAPSDKLGHTHKDTYRRNDGVSSITIKIDFEKSRTATLKIYEAIENGTINKFKIGTKEYFFEKNGSIYCSQCPGDPCSNNSEAVINGIYFDDIEENLNQYYMPLKFECFACSNPNHPFVAISSENDSYKIITPTSGGGFSVDNLSIENSSYKPQNLLYGKGSVTPGGDEKTIQFGLNLTINKTDSLTGAKLSGAEFTMELENISALTGHSPINTTKQIVTATTDSNGQIKLTGILPNNANNNIITVKTTEVKVPDGTGWYYKKLENPVEIKLQYDSSTGWKKISGSGTLSGSTLTVNLTNTPYIDVSGYVWEDGQLGEKVISGPDGVKNEYYKYSEVEQGNGAYIVEYKDGKAEFKEVGEGQGNYIRETITESGLKDVIVELYSVKDAKVIRETTTDLNGNYSFKEIPRTLEGFIVIFKYNGITYVETPQGTLSTASEIDRTKFNNRFKTISAGQSNDGTALTYTYNSDNKTSVLNADIAGHTTGTTDAKFQMSAQTNKFNTTQTALHCGLVKKNFDLAIGTDVKEAKLTINDKTTTYNYQQIMNGEMADLTLDKILQNSSSTSDVIYNLYLYSSDYRYRIKDYQTDVRENKVPDEDNNNIADYVGLNELEAYVTYSVILKGQTTQNATIDEFIYYYDGVYEISEIKTEHFTASIDENQQKITFNRNNIPAQERIVVDITFKIKKNNVGNIIVKEDVTNIAEITKYSTSEGGLIDKDSAPGNANVTFQDGTPKLPEDKYEDDTDEAKGLNIVLRDNETRAITGTVFDDTYKDESKSEYDKDGILNNENAGVNDVIVQLIEIKKIGGQYYEYIWQETRSGSNTVKTTVKNGYHGTTEYRFLKGTDQNPAGTRQIDTENVKNVINIYVEKLNGNGEYKFVDFIPGNYIIRYIYGDGTTYDVTDNVKTYNGQDYKSTIDPNYNNPWYNTSTYAEGSSVARDNEARRLEVMAYSATINGENGADLANKTSTALENTWMCAETSRINIPVDADSTSTADNSTGVSYANIEKTISFSDVNFGLALRPKTNIALEKHITALKITPSGTGVQSIVDAKADSIESIVSGKEVTVAGVTDGLSTIKSTRENRGFWQVATDVEELMQGAELEVEYTYVLRNDGEEDYLSSQLVSEYEGNTSEYSNYLLNIVKEGEGNLKNNLKGKTHDYGTYLGQVYYRGLNKDGSVPETDAKVSTRVEVFEEALNNDLAFDETEGTSFKTAREASKEPVYGVDSAKGTKETEINTVVQNTTVSKFLIPKTGETYKTQTEDTKGSADWSKTITLRTTLSTVGGGELGANLPSHIAEVLQYSNAAGRKDMTATPANLSYVHSDDTEITMASGKNEHDEFWGETIIITKPTGEDKLTPLQIAIITISAVAVLGAGIVLIKKFVLKK